MTTFDPRRFLVSLFDAAVAAADADRAIRAHLPSKPKGRTIVVGAGKGAAHLARALERAWDGPLDGVVVTRYGFGVACDSIEVLEAAHPVPDASGLAASGRLLSMVSNLSEDDLVIALICGGGSALLPAPADGLTLADESELNEVLLASGAPISAMNAIRKHVSRIKGGRLAVAAWPARVVSLIVSDIPGDNPAAVASGPTVADSSGPEDAMGAIRRHRIAVPEKILAHIRNSQSRAPQPGDPRLLHNTYQIIASSAVSLEAAVSAAEAQGIAAVILSDSVEGEAREAANMHAAMAREVLNRNRPFSRPVVLLSGGETTVTINGSGKGGRNTEFLLSLALSLDGYGGVYALAADTDGIDGSEDNAGAFADGTTIARVRTAGMDPTALLSNNDAWTAFDAIGDLFVPGPTGTNVNDFRAILLL